jgi:hypothetical protein
MRGYPVRWIQIRLGRERFCQASHYRSLNNLSWIITICCQTLITTKCFTQPQSPSDDRETSTSIRERESINVLFQLYQGPFVLAKELYMYYNIRVCLDMELLCWCLVMWRAEDILTVLWIPVTRLH